MSTQFFQCPRCRAVNPVRVRFCSNCALPFQQQSQVAPVPVPKKTNSLLLPLGIIFGVIGFCALCGIFASLTDKNSKNEVALKSNNSNANATSNSSPTPAPTPTPFSEIKKNADALSASYKKDSESVSAEECAALVTSLLTIPKDSKDYATAQTLRKSLNAIQAEIFINSPGPRPENSAWDGSVRPAEDYLKQALNDYKSSEYLGWTETRKIKQGKKVYWETTVRLRAKNAFGAYIVRDLTFWIQHNQVVKVKGL